MSKQSGGGLGRASVLMATGSLVSRFLGVIRNAMLVACIGAATAASTAFNTANVLPNSIFQLLAGGLLTSILIPQITKAMRREEDGREAVDSLLTLAFGAVTIVTVLAVIFAAPLITFFQLQGTVRDLGIMFAYLCLPQIFFYGAYAILGQVLNTHDRFAEYMWAPVMANIVQILGMAIFLWQYGQVTEADRWTGPMIWLLAGTSTLGIAVQAAVLIPALRRTGFRWRPNFKVRGYGFRAAGRVAIWTIIAVTIAQIGGIITQQAINSASETARLAGVAVANVTIYLQSYTIFMVPIGIITVSILTAYYPSLSRATLSGDTDEVRSLTVKSMRVPAAILVPITFAALALAVPGVAVLNPAMERWEVLITALSFGCMAIGLVPYSITSLQQRYSMAREDGRTNFTFQVLITAVQIIIAAVVAFVAPPRWAVVLVAIGQTLGHAIASLLFIGLVKSHLGGSWIRSFAGLLGKSALASVVPALAAAGMVHFMTAQLGIGWLASLSQLAAGGIVFVALYAVSARFLKIPEVDSFVASINEYRGRK